MDHRHSPRGNAPCYLRRRKGDNDGLILQTGLRGPGWRLRKSQGSLRAL